MEKNWAPFFDQCWLQVLQLSLCLIDLLSMLLRCNSFPRIQKAAVDQSSSRPPNSDHDHFFGASLALESALEFLLGSATEPVITGCPLLHKIHFLWHITILSRNDSLLLHRIREDNTFQSDSCFDLWSAHEATSYRDFSGWTFL